MSVATALINMHTHKHTHTQIEYSQSGKHTSDNFLQNRKRKRKRILRCYAGFYNVLILIWKIKCYIYIYNYIYLFPLCFLYQLQGFLFVSCSVGVTNIPVHYVSTQDVLHSTPVKNSNTETNIFVYAQNGWKTNHENYYSLALRWPVIYRILQSCCCFSAAMSELLFFSCYDVRTFVFQLLWC